MENAERYKAVGRASERGGEEAKLEFRDSTSVPVDGWVRVAERAWVAIVLSVAERETSGGETERTGPRWEKQKEGRKRMDAAVEAPHEVLLDSRNIYCHLLSHLPADSLSEL